MPSLGVARDCVMRAVMASRLPREVRVAGRRVAAGATRAVACIADAGTDDFEVVATDFADAVLDAFPEEDFDLRPFVLVLKGFATGARLILPSGFVEDFAGGFFVEALSIAYEVRPAETARKTSRIERRRRSIYCTPVGRTALFGCAEVSEITGMGSFCGAE